MRYIFELKVYPTHVIIILSRCQESARSLELSLDFGLSWILKKSGSTRAFLTSSHRSFHFQFISSRKTVKTSIFFPQNLNFSNVFLVTNFEKLVLLMVTSMASKIAISSTLALLKTCTTEIVSPDKRRLCGYTSTVWTRIWLLSSPFVGVTSVFGQLGEWKIPRKRFEQTFFFQFHKRSCHFWILLGQSSLYLLTRHFQSKNWKNQERKNKSKIVMPKTPSFHFVVQLTSFEILEKFSFKKLL